MDTDTIAWLVLTVYCVIGLPVVWLHMRQQKMFESTRQIKHAQVQGLVIYTLAVMWPLLLLSMTLNHFQEKKRREKSAAKTKTPSSES